MARKHTICSAGTNLSDETNIPVCLILIPAFYGDVLQLHLTDGVDKGRGQACIGNQGDVKINGASPDTVVVGEFMGGEILGYVDYQVNFLGLQILHYIWFLILVRPGQVDGVNPIQLQSDPCGLFTWPVKHPDDQRFGR